MSLDIAYLHNQELGAMLSRSSLDNRNRWYFQNGWATYGTEVQDSNWCEQAMVSVGDKGQLLGYFRVSLNRWTGVGSQMATISFAPGSVTFARDFRAFLLLCVAGMGMRKIRWDVVVGNPAEAMYDRLTKRYGGRVVGVLKDECRLSDGGYADQKWYELPCDAAMERLRTEGAL